VQVEYGAHTVVTAKHWLPQDTPKERVEDHFRDQAEAFAAALQTSHPTAPGGFNAQHLAEVPLDIRAYSTVLGEGGIVMSDYQETYNFLALLPLQIKTDNAGIGKQVMYNLLPVSMLSLLSLVQVDVDILPTLPSHECLKRFVQLFDEFRSCQQRLQDYKSYVTKHKLCLPPHHVQDVDDRVHKMKISEQNLRSKYANLLQDVRSGRSGPEPLWRLATDYTSGSSSPKAISTISDDHEGKVNFINTTVAKGATYIGYNGLDLGSELSRQGDRDCYVFSFSDAAKQDVASWEANEALLQSLLNDPQHRAFVAIVDCDAKSLSLERSVISHYRNKSEVCGDLYEQQQFAAEHCFARCDAQKLATGKDIKKPVKRRFVKIACPGVDCDPNEVCGWICPICHAPIEYGFSDQYIYCECGRALYSAFDFKCNGNRHGPRFARCDPRLLLPLLDSLVQSDYLNILILGETGVGKSTFINAFINYLNFETLDESLDADKLHWVIPCSFSTQSMDRSNPNSVIKEQVVRVGASDNEHDGSKGISATQQTAVYPITIGMTTYRLIDTPGIGDTRGIQFDQQNVSDILTTLSSYDDLHGILILLKSNNARLTAQFAYCVKDLLTHLHRNAAANIVFGFTNTRISNYTPGDTFGPLQALLEQHPDVGLSLSNATTYCFDSESFRYLAAYKSKRKVIMDNKEDFCRSWKHSRDEAWRMLSHFQSKPPHPVKSTISLNGTRELICQLTKPMADISQLIRTNMAMCEDDIQKLQDTRLTGDKLRTQLNPQKKCHRTVPLGHPRTVCENEACVEYKDDGTGSNKALTEYISPCHSRCYLTGVKVLTKRPPGLRDCWAFSESETCTQCQHHWTEHMHVLTELEEYMTAVKDVGIAQQVKDNASDITLKNAAIRKRKVLITEYESEHDQIQEAAAKFGLWLKDNSITPYNDATLAYLDVLIKEEEAKARAGYSDDKLQSLHEDYRKHEELVDVLERSMKYDANFRLLDPAGVAQLVQNLYQLTHFGNMLENVKLITTAAHEATYREFPCHIRSKSSYSKWSNLNPLSSLFSRPAPLQQPQLNAYARPVVPNKLVQMQTGFASGSMRPNQQNMLMRLPPRIMASAPPPHQRNSILQQGSFPAGGTPTTMPTQIHPTRPNLLQKPAATTRVKSTKTFSMPSLNPFRKSST
jgi:GTPase SAR1 family protein